ncbi:early nodulin-like protein 5 [Malania oleifera]|uniref:early nodulin-like protein 5 n=1 Tax=Malania oleifera TaxID=397392 RepID=UPI0025AECAD7|nr:early nodulin-like protein 5 [Malania oleifera]
MGDSCLSIKAVKEVWKMMMKLLVLLMMMSSSSSSNGVRGVEFEVGGEKGWTIPSSKDDSQLYNHWASHNRFQLHDTLRFKYKKDSVLVVSNVEYEKCRSSHPMFYSNNGNTLFLLDRHGLFYFISGVAGHCERGQRMIIKVLDTQSPPSAAAGNSSSSASPQSSAGVPQMAAVSFPMIMLFVVASSFLMRTFM